MNERPDQRRRLGTHLLEPAPVFEQQYAETETMLISAAVS